MTLRRATWALLLSALCVAPAQGRVAVVVQQGNFGSATDYLNNSGHAYDSEDLGHQIVAALSTFSALDSFDVFQLGMVKTEWCRTGLFALHNWNTPSVVTRQYSAVIHIGASNGTNLYDGYKRDSLTLSTRDSLGTSTTNALRVPNLIVFPDGNFSTTVRCSLGKVAGIVTDQLPWGWTRFPMTDQTLRYGENNDEVIGVLAAGVPGGVRKLIGGNTSAWHVYNGMGAAPTNTFARPCSDCDSLLADPTQTATNDTGMVWVQLKANQNYAPCGTCAPVASKPLIYGQMSHYIGGGGNGPITLLSMLAALDSASSGGVFNKSVAVGLQIRGGFRRGARNAAGGVSPNDSTNVKAAVDSLSALGIPFTVGVNVDSLTAYPEEAGWWTRAPLARFAPENWGGLDSAKAGNGIAHFYRPLDPLGALRARKYVGDFSGLGADTAYVATLLRLNFRLIDSTFGAQRTDHSLIAPDFRWVPRNAGIANQDSLIYALAMGGVRNIIACPTASYWRNGFKGLAASNNRPQPFTIRYGGLAGMELPVVFTPAPKDSGSAVYNRETLTSSNGTLLLTDGWKSANVVDKFWTGLYYRGGYRTAESGSAAGTNVSNMGMTTDSLAVRHIRVMTIYASDLGSGTRSDWSTLPTRPGWWQAKYLANGAKAINNLCGRTIIQVVPTEQITR